MEINDTSAYIVIRFAPEGESQFHPVLGEDIKNMLRGFDYDSDNEEYVSSDGAIKYKLILIG